MDQEIRDIENVSKDVENLEMQIKTMNQKLHDLTNNIKKEEQKKNWYEVKIDEFKESTNFYQTQAAKMSKRLVVSTKICSQFELATECYKRLMAVYDEKYLKLQGEVDNNDGELYSNLGKENNTKRIKEEIAKCKIEIQENLEKINNLLPSDINEE